MTKKELKDIILKTLEKEGGAAGIKALAKAAKTSKNKLKKDLDDMSGVKQHQDGDYISTPINEVETFTGSPEAAADFCQRCPTHMCSSVDYTPGGQVIAVCQELDPFDEFTASGAIGTGRIVGPRYRKPMFKRPGRINEESLLLEYQKPYWFPTGIDCGYCYEQGCQCSLAYGCSPLGESCRNPIDKPDKIHDTGVNPDPMWLDEPVDGDMNPSFLNDPKLPMSKKPIRPRKPMPKQQMGGAMSRCDNDSDCRGTAICVNGFCLENPNPDIPRDARLYNRRITRLREVKEIIGTMLNEKKKKKKDRCHRKADQVYGTKTSAYKSGAIVKCRKGMIWKKKK